MKELESLEVGDKVVVADSWGNEEIASVTEIFKKYIKTGWRPYDSFSKDTGKRWGSARSNSVGRIYPATEKDIKRVEADNEHKDSLKSVCNIFEEIANAAECDRDCCCCGGTYYSSESLEESLKDLLKERTTEELESIYETLSEIKGE